jgi:AmiR/NasT family two-component response regulator
VPSAAPAIESLIVVAMDILMARRSCTTDDAFALLSDAARGHDMSVSDQAACLVADQELR